MLICGGGREALFVVTQMLVEPGDEVLVLDPAPVAYAEGVRLAGGIPILVPTRPEDGFALKAEAVLARLTPRSRVLLVASPAAPTGGVIAGADLAALADLARRYNLQVIWDETYRDYRFDGGAHEQIAALPGMRERTVIVGSFSTRYAMSGWRAGYVLGPAHLLRPVALMKQSLTICSPAPTQWAALAALTGPQRAIGEAVREATLRRAAALRALAALGLTCGGTGTPYLFIDLRGLGVAGRDFAAAALRDARVRLAPGEDYGPSGAGFVRLTLSAPVAVLESAIGRLAPVVARFRGEVGQKGGL